MKLFVTSERNLNFAIDLSLDGNLLTYVIRKAIPSKTPEGEDMPLAEGQTLFAKQGEWLVIDEIEHQEVIDLNIFKNMPDFHDHSAFCIYRPVGIRADWVSAAHKQPVNLFAMTVGSKMSGPQFHDNVSGLHPLMNILVPFKNSPLSDWHIGVNTFSPDLVTTHGDLEKEECSGLDVVRNTHLPKVWFSSKSVPCQKEQSISVDFFIGDSDGNPIQGDAEVFLDVTGGSLNKYRAQTVNGTGSVTFRALDLEAGDVVKIKCGFKYFTGTDDCLVSIT